MIVDISPISNCKQLTHGMLNILKAMKTFNFEGLKTPSAARKEARTKLRTHIKDDITLNAVIQNIGTLKSGGTGWICNLEALLKNFNNILSFVPSNFENKKYSGPVLIIGGQRSEFVP